MQILTQAGLGEDLRFCISNKPPGNTDNASSVIMSAKSSIMALTAHYSGRLKPPGDDV